MNYTFAKSNATPTFWNQFLEEKENISVKKTKFEVNLMSKFMTYMTCGLAMISEFNSFKCWYLTMRLVQIN